MKLIVIVIYIFLPACSGKSKQKNLETDKRSNTVKKEKQKIQIINTATLKKDFLGKTGVVLIDNRPSHKFRKLGHLPRAINLPWFKQGHPANVMTKKLLMKYAQGKIIVFYCTGALRAWHAAKAAIEWGFPPEKIYWYKVGWNGYSNKQM